MDIKSGNTWKKKRSFLIRTAVIMIITLIRNTIWKLTCLESVEKF